MNKKKSYSFFIFYGKIDIGDNNGIYNVKFTYYNCCFIGYNNI